jgi:hypothetical protein
MNSNYARGRSNRPIDESEDFPPLAERPKSRVKSPIKFELQRARPDISPTNAHESRFLLFNDNPRIFSKSRKVPSPSFSKSPGRKSKALDISKLTDYNPKIDTVKDLAGKGSSKWKTKQGRKEALGATTDLIHAVKYQSIDRKVSVPCYKKAASVRPRSTMGKLPRFMESTASRSALRLITDKSLKMNKFAELAFFMPESSFCQRNWDSQYLSRTMRSGKDFPKL